MTFGSSRVNAEGKLIPAYSLYPVNGVTWATAFGSVFAGGIVMAINFGRLNRANAQRNVLFLSAVGTLAVLIAAYSLPDNLPAAVFYFPQVAVMYFLANSQQGPAIEAHKKAGGSMASVWRAIGIGCISGLAVLIGAAAFIVAFDSDPVVKLNEKDEVFYSGDATEEDALLLGNILTDIGVFGHPEGSSVLLDRSSNRHTVSFILPEDDWKDPEVVASFRELGEILADRIYGRPLIVALCDGYFNSRRQLLIE